MVPCRGSSSSWRNRDAFPGGPILFLRRRRGRASGFPSEGPRRSACAAAINIIRSNPSQSFKEFTLSFLTAVCYDLIIRSRPILFHFPLYISQKEPQTSDQACLRFLFVSTGPEGREADSGPFRPEQAVHCPAGSLCSGISSGNA